MWEVKNLREKLVKMKESPGSTEAKISTKDSPGGGPK